MWWDSPRRVLLLEGVKLEGEVSFVVQIGQSVIQQGLLPVLVQIGVEKDFDEGLQCVVRDFLLFYQVKDGVFLPQYQIQVNGAAVLAEDLLNLRQGIVRDIVQEQAQPFGNLHQHFANPVNFSNDIIFHNSIQR